MILAWQSVHASQKLERGSFVATDCVLWFTSQSCSCVGKQSSTSFGQAISLIAYDRALATLLGPYLHTNVGASDV